MINLKLRDRRIYRMNRSHAVTMPIVWLDLWAGQIGNFVHMEIGTNGELIITPAKEVRNANR